MTKHTSFRELKLTEDQLIWLVDKASKATDTFGPPVFRYDNGQWYAESAELKIQLAVVRSEYRISTWE